MQAVTMHVHADMLYKIFAVSLILLRLTLKLSKSGHLINLTGGTAPALTRFPLCYFKGNLITKYSRD